MENFVNYMKVDFSDPTIILDIVYSAVLFTFRPLHCFHVFLSDIERLKIHTVFDRMYSYSEIFILLLPIKCAPNF